MKFKITLLTIATILSLLSCQKDEQITKPELSIVGEWVYEYELLSDGTKDFDNPYALLEFEYSDGFILKENGTGNSVWNDVINNNFDWTSDNSKLIISLIESANIFEYKVSILTDETMFFETPKGHKYFMNKQ